MTTRLIILTYISFIVLSFSSCKDDEPGNNQVPTQSSMFYEPDCKVYREIIAACEGKIWTGEEFEDVSKINLNAPREWGNISWKYIPELNKYRIVGLQLISLNDTSKHANIPESIGKLSSLDGLTIAGSTFEGVLTDKICNLNLSALAIRGCRFTSLPDNLFTDKLEYLIIEDLPITELPPSVVNLRSYTDLDYNPKFMHYIVYCKNLTGKAPSTPYAFVNLFQNSFTSVDFNNVIPDTVTDPLNGRKCLRGQTLDFNQLTGEIPDSIVNDEDILKKFLKYTGIQTNSKYGFTNIPDSFFNHPNDSEGDEL